MMIILCKCSHRFVLYIRHLFSCRSSKIRQRRCGFVWQSICCRFVVLLWSVCHENDLKYREERIPEISNWWLSLKLRTTDVVSFQITVPSSCPPLSPCLYPSVGHENYSSEQAKHKALHTKLPLNTTLSHIFHTSY